MGLIPGLGRAPREEKGYPLQYSGLENSKGCIGHGVTKRYNWVAFNFTFHVYSQNFWKCSTGSYKLVHARSNTELSKEISYTHLKAGREWDNRGWDGWMASLTQWTWVGDGQGGLACCSPWGRKEEWATELNGIDTEGRRSSTSQREVLKIKSILLMSWSQTSSLQNCKKNLYSTHIVFGCWGASHRLVSPVFTQPQDQRKSLESATKITVV